MPLVRRVVPRLPEPRSHRSSRQNLPRRGASSVEFAIVLPILLLFVGASIEFTRLAMVRHVTDNASYEAARWVIVPGASEQEARDRALAVLDTLGLQNATITISPSPIEEDTSAVTVRVVVPLDDNRWILMKCCFTWCCFWGIVGGQPARSGFPGTCWISGESQHANLQERWASPGTRP